jgi:hypothetical protein
LRYNSSSEDSLKLIRSLVKKRKRKRKAKDKEKEADIKIGDVLQPRYIISSYKEYRKYLEEKAI